jgi:hypothetical protein
LCLKPSTPLSLARFIHWLTAPSLTPRASAICLRSKHDDGGKDNRWVSEDNKHHGDKVLNDKFCEHKNNGEHKDNDDNGHANDNDDDES